MSAPSPATVEVVRNAFISGAEQMRRNLYRSAYSPVIYEAKDCSVGIFDAEGRLLGQAPGLPFFLGSLGGTLRAVIGIKGYEVFRDGDVWIVNDSTIAGSHLNDVTVFAPIFVDGLLRGFSAAKAHWNDIGAKRAGYVGDSVDIFQEGLRIGPTCIFRDGRLDQQIVDLIALNSRFPIALVGDLMAEISACRTGVERFRSIVQRFGWDQVETSLRLVFDQAEVEDRASVAEIPDGAYVADGYLDNDGVTEDPVYVKVTVTVEGDRMTVDLSGSNRQCVGSINSGLVQTRSAIEQGFKFLVNPNAPVSGGNFRNLKVIAPEGTCFNPSETAPCLHYGPHLMLAIDLMIKALSEVIPERTAAGHVGDSWNVSIVGENEFGLFLSGESLTGGWGAYEGGDGESALTHSAAGEYRNQPIEALENRYPFLMHRHALRDGSGGAGKWRGGLGIIREYELLAPCTVNLWFERAKQPSWGLFGGQAGLPPEVWVHRPGKEPVKMFKANGMKVEAGTRLLVRTGGGGGWGDPAERAVTDRERDRRLEMVI
ncbi:hydantoinase B/oxoprolinase family protein [Candidatus Spongiisocius sp.]|uniref:hydantoinase B/oxoprolinase family protein n=1 Tax=Candidatus Spongiisocius sp. TaxID=3101273 RepID=UPI003B58C72C